MRVKKDYTGLKVNRLTFVRPTAEKRRRNTIWELVCDCGNTYHNIGTPIINGHVKSCGCLAKETAQCNGEQTRKYSPNISSARIVWSRSYKDIDFDTFYRLSQLSCYYCGCAPYKTYNSITSGDVIFSSIQKNGGNFIYNGLDRVDNTRGHTLDNVVPCCYKCNTFKMTRSFEQFLEHIERLYEHTKELRQIRMLKSTG